MTMMRAVTHLQSYSPLRDHHQNSGQQWPGRGGGGKGERVVQGILMRPGDRKGYKRRITAEVKGEGKEGRKEEGATINTTLIGDNIHIQCTHTSLLH